MTVSYIRITNVKIAPMITTLSLDTRVFAPFLPLKGVRDRTTYLYARTNIQYFKVVLPHSFYFCFIYHSQHRFLK